MPDVYQKKTCRLCEGRNLEQVVHLTATPPGNHFVFREDLDVVQATYPLDVNFCADCHHLQLSDVVSPEILYQKNYSYVSGTSPVFVRHLQEYARSIIAQYAPPAGGLVLDVGSNDGTALRCFQEAGYKVLGLDPAVEIVSAANEGGIETLCEFFNLKVARKYRDHYGKAVLINSHNACAHIDDLPSVIEGVEYWLADDGLFVMEVGYLLDVVENGWFDTIYHEHVDFHSVAPLVGFLRRLGFEIISVERISPQGGSIRVIMQKIGGSRRPDRSVADLIALERAKGLDQAETFRAFGQKIDRVGEELSLLLAGLKARGATIAGYGAPTKATTLLTHFKLGSILDFLVDDNPLKQGLFSPGLHIPVYSAEALYQRKPDFLLILAWNFADNIRARHQAYRAGGGRFILPMPRPEICS
jgi:SAM-dependent methyltransferase